MSQTLTVTVKEIEGRGLIVSVPNQVRDGLIRRRDLSWDRAESFNVYQFSVGQNLEVVELEDKPYYQFLPLSLRQTTDPWGDAYKQKKFKEGMEISCTVVNILRGAIFVQIEPGIDGRIEAEHVSHFFPEKPLHEIIRLGDVVVGMVTDVNWELRHITLSLTEYLQKINQFNKSDRLNLQRLLFEDKKLFGNKSGTLNNRDIKQIHHPPASFIGNDFLIVDDEEHAGNGLKAALSEICYGKIWFASNQKEAEEAIHDSMGKIGLAIIDYSLEKQTGYIVGKALKEKHPYLSILITSSDPMADFKLPDTLEGEKVEFCRKEGRIITDWINRRRRGYTEYIVPQGEQARQNRLLQQIGAANVLHKPLRDELQDTLRYLNVDIKASHIFVLDVNRQEKSVEILACDPPISTITRGVGRDYFLRSLDRLYHSPVREIIADQDEYYQDKIPAYKPKTLRYFFSYLNYKTIYGLPIFISGINPRYILFVLDETKSSFDENLKNQIQITALICRSQIERAINFEYMRRFEQRYSLGELLGSFVHELRNKLGVIDPTTKRIDVIAQKLAKPDLLSGKRDELIVELGEKSRLLQKGQGELEVLIESFSQVARGDFEFVDLNSLVSKVVKELSYMAAENDVTLIFESDPRMPLVWVGR
ncbi:MAG: hypothetical protein AAF902_25785, partial [Chloroflexota bacterium]